MTLAYIADFSFLDFIHTMFKIFKKYSVKYVYCYRSKIQGGRIQYFKCFKTNGGMSLSTFTQVLFLCLNDFYFSHLLKLFNKSFLCFTNQ